MTFGYPTPVDPLLGGSLSTGPTGLSGLVGQVPGLGMNLPGVGSLPYTSGAGGGAGGLGARLASVAPNVSGFGLPEGMGLMGAARAAGPYVAAGQLANMGFDKLTPGSHNSNVEQGLQGAATGAGIGAGIGALGGLGVADWLTIPVGAGVGGVIGGALGVLGNTFGWGGDKKDDSQSIKEKGEEILGRAITTAGLDDATTAQILDTYEVQLQFAEALDGKDKEAAQVQALNAASQMVLNAMGQRQQGTQDASNVLAIQAMANQTFQPIADDIRSGAAAYGTAMQGIRPNLPAMMQPIADMTLARELTSADRLANAYQAQAAMTPILQQLTQYQKDQQNLAAQQFSQMLAQQAAGGGTGMNGGSTQDVLAALGAA